MKKVYFLIGLFIPVLFCGKIYGKDSLFDSFIDKATKMIDDPEVLLATILKEVNLPFLANFQKHITALQQITQLSQITDLQKQLLIVKNSTGKTQAQALQKAVADFQTVIPLITYLFKKDSSGEGLITQALSSLNQKSVANSLGKMTESIDLVGDTSMALLNMQDQKKSTDKKPAAGKKLTPEERADQLERDLDHKLDKLDQILDTRMNRLDKKLSAIDLRIDAETREKAKNLLPTPKKTVEKVWKEKQIKESSLEERIVLALEAENKASSLVSSFNKLNFEALITASKKVNTGELSYAQSGITTLLKEISTGLEEIIGKKDSFAILILRVIGTGQAVSIANRLVTTSRAIATFMNTIADVVLLSQIMKSIPSSNAPIPTVIEPWPATQGDLDFS